MERCGWCVQIVDNMAKQITKINTLKFEEWANTQLKVLQEKLLLTHFTLQPIIASKKNCSECLFAYPYKDIQVRYSVDVLQDFIDGNTRDAFQVLVHEMCHPLTDPLYGVATDRYCNKTQMENEREALTDHIANIVLKHIV